ncbi:hypothetical protein [Burkholderia ubonensis]|uniref:hypothetical protein n=1 Tax=Burkholderia ubonensis TaxID=101571 RepID=UPI001E617EAA|nr:hypothetical protein [Burkholderia ubonensis]
MTPGRPERLIACSTVAAFISKLLPPLLLRVSGIRDVMVYGADGKQKVGDLLDHRLVRVYLHTLTNGVLVAGDNSKMSVLEKLVRLALEN